MIIKQIFLAVFKPIGQALGFLLWLFCACVLWVATLFGLLASVVVILIIMFVVFIIGEISDWDIKRKHKHWR